MTLDDSGWILTKADFWWREVGECTVRQDELTVFLRSRRCHSDLLSSRRRSKASKLVVCDDVTGGNCWNAGYISTFKVRFLVERSVKDAETVVSVYNLQGGE